MHRSNALAFLIVLTACLSAPSVAFGGTGATGCDDLGGIPPSPAVDFDTEIQPILDGCASCHDAAGPAGLDLRAGESYDNLVGVISNTNPSRLRVDPGEPELSALFLAVNCDSPGGPGFRMPGADQTETALIRDWIAQGALAEPAGTPTPLPVPTNPLWSMLLLATLLLGCGAYGLSQR